MASIPNPTARCVFPTPGGPRKSATTDKRELISGELTLRKRISKLIEQKRNYRKGRRNKLWHRKPRFNNSYLIISIILPFKAFSALLAFASHN
ncbi:hypothetical protein IPdc08_01651 [archaeon]|nr:hypothetical protein IPdc08_01651 [archaeon]